ncbi:hypothetical protein Gobs01_02851 [Geodermatophilus obscurus DSM 43160]
MPYYQPVVSTTTGEVLGLEALVRWEHPTRGVLAPGAFIEVALETGLFVPLGRRVLELACRDLAVWDTLGRSRPWVSVDIDAQQLHLEASPTTWPASCAAPAPTPTGSGWSSPRTRSSTWPRWRWPVGCPRSACGWRSTTSAPGTRR